MSDWASRVKSWSKDVAPAAARRGERANAPSPDRTVPLGFPIAALPESKSPGTVMPNRVISFVSQPANYAPPFVFNGVGGLLLLFLHRPLT
jgi:hypothetical protein